MPLLANQFVWTAQDEFERLLATQQLGDKGRQRQLARTAILNVLRELPNRSRWSYFDRRRTLRTDASDTGTCTYDHTGGSNERLLTLASATLPTDGTGEYYRVVIDSVHYDIQRVLTSTTAMLEPNNNPGADVTAGTACTIYRAFYPLPVGFRKLIRVYDIDQDREMRIVLEDEQHAQAISIFSDPSTPEWVCLTNRGEALSSMGLLFSPPPSAGKTYDIMYEAAPQPIWTWKYSDGKVSTSSVTATLSDGGTANANMVGAIMRLTTSIAQEPTSMVGAMDGKDNPFSQQRLIVEYTSSSVLKLDSSVDTLTTVKYTISDPIDIEPGAMLAAFQKMCDYEYASLLKVTDKERAFLKAEAAQMLRLAMENDRRTTYARTNTPVYDRFSHTTMDTD